MSWQVSTSDATAAQRAPPSSPDLRPAIGVHADRDGHSDRDDPPGLADLHVGGVEPEIGPVAFDGAAEEVAQAERDGGQRGGAASEERERIKALEREVRELRQANQMLRKASAHFAQAELDRRFKP